MKFNLSREFIILLLILILASFVRLYQIFDLNFFTYDQARDALFIKRIIIDHKFRLIGTQSSIPGLYTGPFYYYLMVPFLLLFNLNPAGLDLGTAFFGVISVYLLYIILKSLTKNSWVSLIIAALYALQPQIVQQSRFAWNPNTTPFFVLIFILSLHKLINGSRLYWLGVFIPLAIVLQLHYSGMCLIPALMIIVFMFRKKIVLGKWFFLSVFIFCVLMSPLVFFDVRHDFISIKAVVKYLIEGTKSNIPPPPFVWGIFDKMRYLLVELVFGIKNYFISITAILSLLIFSIYTIIKKPASREGLIITWTIFLLGVLIASIYKGSFFNFYLTFLYPLGFLILGILLKTIWKLLAVKIFATFLLLIVIIFNLKASTVSLKRNNLTPDFLKVTSVIASDINDYKQINLVRVGGADRFDYNAVDYRYFLETFQHKKVLDWDVLDYQNAEILYLISHEGEVNPLALNVWEINMFSPKEIVNRWKVNDMIWIYKLNK